MFTSFRSAVLAAILAIGLLLPSGVGAQEFSQDQREELGEIIRDYLLENPQVLREMIQALEVQEREADAAAAKAAIAGQGDEIYHSDGDFVAGNPDGSVAMVEFFDYNCGFCKRAMGDVVKLIGTNQDLRVVLKEWPILSEGSLFAARAAVASRRQGKYWEFHLALMETRRVDEETTLEAARSVGLDVEQLQADMEKPEVTEVIERNARLAELLGIQGTPAFLVDDQLIEGAVGYDALSEAVARVRGEGGCVIC
jgi:protein-disulfide isomerase